MSSISSGQLAKLFDLPKPTIRHYVTEGLLSPKINEKNGYQQFVERDIYKLYQIIFLRRIGFSIEKIKDMLKTDSVLNDLTESITVINEQIKELMAVKETVSTIVAASNNLRLNDIQFLEKDKRYLQELPSELQKKDEVDLLKAHDLGYSHLDLFFFILDDSLEEKIYGLCEQEDSEKILIEGTYACKNIEYISHRQLEEEIRMFLQEPLLEISRGKEIIVYENIYSSLGYSDKQIITLEIQL